MFLFEYNTYFVFYSIAQRWQKDDSFDTKTLFQIAQIMEVKQPAGSSIVSDILSYYSSFCVGFSTQAATQDFTLLSISDIFQVSKLIVKRQVLS